MLFDLKTVENLAERIAGLLPEDARVLREEFKANVRPLIESMLARMDLVTREEFDAQARVLAHTREKLDRIERQLAALEAEQPAP